MPSKFEIIRRISEILHTIRPQIGKYCDAEEPEEMIHSRVEIREESLLKVTEGFYQMHIEDDVERVEEEEYIILEEVYNFRRGCADNFTETS